MLNAIGSCKGSRSATATFMPETVNIDWNELEGYLREDGVDVNDLRPKILPQQLGQSDTDVIVGCLQSRGFQFPNPPVNLTIVNITEQVDLGKYWSESAALKGLYALYSKSIAEMSSLGQELSDMDIGFWHFTRSTRKLDEFMKARHDVRTRAAKVFDEIHDVITSPPITVNKDHSSLDLQIYLATTELMLRAIERILNRIQDLEREKRRQYDNQHALTLAFLSISITLVVGLAPIIINLFSG